MKRLPFLLFLFSLMACNLPKIGSMSPEVRTELDDLADQPIDMDEKYLGLARIVTGLLDEAAAMPQNAAAGAHLAEFFADNEGALQRLTIQLDNWEKNMTPEERMFFLMKLQAQPYTPRLNTLHNGMKNRLADQPEAANQLELIMRPLQFHR